jgi:hypothetical protein
LYKAWVELSIQAFSLLEKAATLNAQRSTPNFSIQNAFVVERWALSVERWMLNVLN